MRKLIFILSALILSLSVCAQEIEVSGTRKAVRTSGDVGALLLPVAGVTAVLLQKDWQGLKQGVFSGGSHIRTEIYCQKRTSRP